MLKVCIAVGSFFLLSNISLKAQTLSFGPIAGLNVSSITNVPNAQATTGLAIGGLMNYSVNENVGLGARVLFSQLGTAFESSEATHRLNYIQIPLTGVYYFGNSGDKLRPKVFAGPYVGFLLSAEDNNGNNLIGPNGDDFFKQIDFGGLLGLGFNYLLKSRTWLNVEAAYAGSFANISEFGLGNYKNTSLGFNVGVSFPVGVN